MNPAPKPSRSARRSAAPGLGRFARAASAACAFSALVSASDVARAGSPMPAPEPAPPSPTNTPRAPYEGDFAAAAPSDIYARTPEERELCAKAAKPDLLYIGASAAAVVGSVAFHSVYKYDNHTYVRLGGASLVGLSWGFFVGGTVLALPKCSPSWIGESPREGSVRRNWPLALSLALVSAVTGPFLMAVEQGFTYDPHWTLAERQGRLLLAGGFGFVGALLPYVLPPKTWRAARTLEKIRAVPYAGGGLVGYSFQF